MCFNNPRQLTSEAAFNVQLKPQTQAVVLIQGPFVPPLFFSALSFAIAEVLGFSLGRGWLFFFKKASLQFSYAGSAWGLGSQLAVSIRHQGRARLVLVPGSCCQTVQIHRLSKMPLGHISSLSTFNYCAIRGKYLARTRPGPALRHAGVI